MEAMQKKKKKRNRQENHKVPPCFLCSDIQVRQRGMELKLKAVADIKARKNHHCYCHPIFSSFFFPFHSEYLATKGVHLMRTHPMSAKDLIMCVLVEPCATLWTTKYTVNDVGWAT